MILVAGATSHVGKGLVPLFINASVKIQILVRDEHKASEWRNKVEIARGDLDRPETLATAMQGIDQLFFVTPVTFAELRCFMAFIILKEL